MPRPDGRPLVVLLAVLVVAGAALPALAPAAAASADGYVYLTTETTPEQPTTEEEFTFTATFRSADASDSPLEVERIELRDGPGEDADVIAEKSFFGDSPPTLRPGGTLDRNFSVEFDEPGTREVVVEVTFRTSAGITSTVEYRTTLTVYRPAPRIEVSAAPTVAGERTNLSVTVANGLDGTVRDLELTLDAEGVEFDERSRVASRLAGGAARTFGFGATPETLGDRPVTATLEYTGPDGTRRTVTREIDVRFRARDLDGDVGVEADVAPALPGAETTLNLTLANGLDRTIRQLEVRVAADGATVVSNRRVATGVASGTERTFRFTVNRSTTGEQPVEVTVAYTTADGIEGEFTETVSTTFRAPTNPGRVTLTGAEAVQRGDAVEVSATASNVGGSDVESVVVSVADAPEVVPADYFVGSVDASDFASFTLTTRASANLTSIPVEVTYVVDGVRRSRTVEVPVEQAVVRRPGDGGGGPPLVPAAAAVVLLVVLAVAYRRWG